MAKIEKLPEGVTLRKTTAGALSLYRSATHCRIVEKHGIQIGHYFHRGLKWHWVYRWPVGSYKKNGEVETERKALEAILGVHEPKPAVPPQTDAEKFNLAVDAAARAEQILKSPPPPAPRSPDYAFAELALHEIVQAAIQDARNGKPALLRSLLHALFEILKTQPAPEWLAKITPAIVANGLAAVGMWNLFKTSRGIGVDAPKATP